MIEADRLAALLVEALPVHIARQRWSGVGDRRVAEVSLRWMELVDPGEPLLAWALVDARLDDGAQHSYQLFVGGRGADHEPEFLRGKERELVGVVPDGDSEVVLYDALVDPDLAVDVLHLVAPEVEVQVRRPLVLEHSNSSLVFDESTILKIFRKVVPGPNPDVEITRELAAAGCEHVLAPLAELNRDGTDLAVLREYLVGATDGWQLARTSVRDLLASRLAPEDCGGDLGPNMERLGATIADLHLAMAAVWDSKPGDVARWADEMESCLAGLHHDSLDVDAVRDRLGAIRALVDPGREIRIHGDLHLAQVIRAGSGWMVIDFEGEPARIPEGRFTMSSPLRDVAGILRSFHYAAASGLAEWDEGDAELTALLEAWEQRNREMFLAGYLGSAGIGDLLPASSGDRDDLLGAFELDKAVYELGYELGHRPEHVAIPLAGIVRLLQPSATR